LLVDDVQGFKSDARFSAAESHPNITIRLFNPWHSRARVTRGFEFVSRMGTLNHRLHNKTIIADGRVGLIGGRNIGDRYFGIYDVFVQNDLDIMFAGPILEPVIEDFDVFWNSAAAIPVKDHVRSGRQNLSLDELRAQLAHEIREQAPRIASFDSTPGDWADWWDALSMRKSVGNAEYMTDSPDFERGGMSELAPELFALLARAEHEIVLCTAYFIADEQMMSLIEHLTQSGVRIVVLTNSIQSNNHMLAHVGYRTWRERLIAAGAEVFELHPEPALMPDYAVPPVNPGYMGLHGKAVVVDGRWAFVGTPNLDPRSLELNAESGIVVDSPELASLLKALILEATLPENAWHVTLDERGSTQWTDADGTIDSEPVRGLVQRLKQFFFRLMPIKRLA
jgi:putative cardiolipin synthase